MPDIVSPRHKQGLSGWYLPARPVLWKMIVPGVGISRSLSILAIFPVPLPSTQSWKINLTMGAVSSSITSCPVSSLIYPYGTMPPSRWPDIPLLRKTARTFLLVSFAYHSLNRCCWGRVRKVLKKPGFIRDCGGLAPDCSHPGIENGKSRQLHTVFCGRM